MNAKTIAQYLYQNKKRNFTIGLVFLGFSLFSFLNLQIDGNLSGNIVKESSFYRAAQKIKSAFKLEDVIQVKISPKKDLLLKDFLISLEHLIQIQKRSYPKIQVTSLLDFKKHFHLEQISITDKTLDAFKKIKKMPLASDFISKDGRSAQILFSVGTDFEITLFDHNIEKPYMGIDNLTALSRFHIEKSVSAFITADLSLLTLLMIILSFIVMFLTFKNTRYIFGCLAFLLFGTLCGLSSFALFNIKINIVTILVLPIIIVLTLSDIIHLLSGIRFSQQVVKKEIIIESFQQYIIPSFLTSLTTAIAFYSFSFSKIPNMKDFGIVSATGVALTFIVIFLMAPYIFDKFLVKLTDQPQKKVYNKQVDTILAKFKEYRLFVLFAFITSLVMSVFLVNKLQFKTSSSIFFPKDSEIRTVHDQLNKDFNSLLSMDILIYPPKYPDIGFDFKWDTTDIPKGIYLLSKQVQQVEKVKNVSSLGRVIEYFYDKGLTLSDWFREDYANQLNFEDRHLVKVWFENADDVMDSYPKIKKILDSYKKDFRYEISSIVLLNSEVDLFLSQNIFISLMSSGLIILLILYYLSLSFRVTLICLIANIFPLSSIILIFYFFNFKLNLITAMSSIICIGIIVDDTIHVIYRWKNDMSIKNLAHGMFTTSVILSAGFGMFSFSQFEPSRILGVVCSLTFILAVISDLIILPWFLEKIPRKGKINV
ncbi:MAG: MMPL family transporter [Halobacteriovoraceae bacterium]|jgi:uncharacterized protein|nr:MMPL family transporter [Halobacteriovoraceae bacterium]